MEQTLSAPFLDVRSSCLDRERDMYASCLDRKRDVRASCTKPCALNLEKE